MIEVFYNKKYQKDFDVEQSDTYKSAFVESDFFPVRFVENDKCIYFDFLAPEGPYSMELLNRTGNEFSYNRIMVDDYIEISDYNHCMYESLAFGKILSQRLIDQFTDHSFTILIVGDGEFVSVTFMKRREEKEEQLLLDLDSYDEHIIRIEVS
jgi:hypothetical protein